MKLNLTADELLTTTRAVRKRLDLDRPVEPEVVEECIDIALQAPTGSNAQGWQWVIVTEPELKQAIADFYGRNFDAYAGRADQPTYAADDPRHEQRPRVVSSATYLRENFHRVPVMVIPCIAGRLDTGTSTMMQASAWGSLLPAVWSFVLALRERGLGSAWTTLHLPNEREVADLLGIPFDRVTQAGLFLVAYTLGTDFRRVERLGAADVMHWNRW